MKPVTFIKQFLFVFATSLIIANASHAQVNPNFELPPNLVTKIAYLQQEPQKHGDRLAAIDSLITQLRNLKFSSLEAGIRKADLKAETLQLMKARSAGFITVEDYLSLQGIERSYSLGVSSDVGQYTILVTRKDLKHWSEAYIDFDIEWRNTSNHTELFMDRVTSTDKPIFFFVPNQVVTHPKAGITKAEFLWLMAHPERMKNVVFVFGAYDFVTPQIQTLREEAGLSQNALKALLLRALGYGPSFWDDEV